MASNLSKAYPWTILVFPAASEIGLEINRALRDSKEVRLVAANLPGPSVADAHYRTVHALPALDAPDFLSQLRHLIATCAIDAIYPAHDDVLAAFAAWGDAVPVPVIASPPETCRICRSKSLTYERLGPNLPVPRRYDPTAAQLLWPLFVKPDVGQGSQRARLVTDRTALQAALAAEPDLLALEYLPGPEYTVDCFATPEQGVLFAAPRLRRQAKAGIAVLTEPAKLPEAWHYAELIHATLPMRGAWFFQLKTAANGQLKILEVAPRIAGSMALSHALGPNLPLLSLYAAAGQKVALDCMPGRVRLARSLDTRFLDPRPFGVLYLDLDDTLLTQNGVNSRMMALIFNCHNRGIPVNLITRHHGDLTTTLQCYRLTGLFTRIIHLVNPDDTKASYINEPDAVLVDDSFSERHAAIQARGIRAYDAAGAACLIDERI